MHPQISHKGCFTFMAARRFWVHFSGVWSLNSLTPSFPVTVSSIHHALESQERGVISRHGGIWRYSCCPQLLSLSWPIALCHWGNPLTEPFTSVNDQVPQNLQSPTPRGRFGPVLVSSGRFMLSFDAHIVEERQSDLFWLCVVECPSSNKYFKAPSPFILWRWGSQVYPSVSIQFTMSTFQC